MKTDKELLQLAARAVGITLDYRHGSGVFYYDDELTGREEFDPLDNDGQALRLAVDFEFDIMPMGYYVVVTDIGGHTTEQEYENDKHAATRRAIVRAAAAIGEGME